MAGNFKKIVIAFLISTLFSSCVALHWEFPPFCFYHECVSHQWRGVYRIGHKIKYSGKRAIAKIHKKKHTSVPKETKKPIGIAGTDSLKITVNYPFNGDIISEKNKKEIKKSLENIDITNITSIKVKGYTDNRGTDTFNKTLSANRAKRVYEYLIELGIPSSKLSSQGLDSQNPIGDNTNDEGAKLNRRVEIEIY